MQLGEPFAFVRLWEMWRYSQGKTVPSCTIITAAGNDLLRPNHERIPLVLRRDMEVFWLDHSIHDPTALGSLLAPSHDDGMEVYEVSTLVTFAPTSDPK